MKSKKICVILAMVLFSLSISSCGNSMGQEERMTESSTEESESITEETETPKETETQKETETLKETQKETETTKESKDNKVESESTESKDNKASETSKASTPKEESKPVATTAPKATETPKETTPVHTHKYTSSISQQATCSVPGILSYSCECGDSYQESIPCVDHVWQDTYETIHHEAQGEMQQVQVGTSGDVYICNYCNAEFSSASACSDHKAASGDRDHAFSNTIIRDGGPIYENKWIVTQEQYDEVIVTGQICVNCGLTR